MQQLKENYFEDQLENRASIIAPDEGEKLSIGTISITFKVTSELSNDQLGVYEISLPPMAIGAKLHYHRFMDETFIVKEGTLSMQVGDEEYQAPAGTVVSFITDGKPGSIEWSIFRVSFTPQQLIF